MSVLFDKTATAARIGIAHDRVRESPIHGVIPPLLTPLTNEGLLDTPALNRLVDRVLAGGVHGVFVMGTTGEASSLPAATRFEAMRVVCHRVRGSVSVLVGVTAPSLSETLAGVEAAEKLGADAVVVSSPYYFRLEQEELFRYVNAVVERSSLPVFLYNIPELTRTEFSVDVVRRCLDLPGIVGIKDSSANPKYFAAIERVAMARPDWSVLVGSDELFAEMALKGFCGVVSGAANVHPELVVSLYNAAAESQLEEVAALQSQLQRLTTTFGHGGYGIGAIRGAKAALASIGVCGPTMAPPFLACGAEQRLLIDDTLRQLRLLETAPPGPDRKAFL